MNFRTKQRKVISSKASSEELSVALAENFRDTRLDLDDVDAKLVEGSGSGVDADLLDGEHKTYFATDARMDAAEGDISSIEAVLAEIKRFPHAIGEPVAWYCETVPDLCVKLNGASYVRTDKADLFAAYGTLYGAEDSTHFNVPNLCGVFLRGWNDSRASGMYDPDASTRTKPAATGATISDGDHVGTEQQSAMWGHWHRTYSRTNYAVSTGQALTPSTTAGATENDVSVTTILSDGTHGTPLLSSESRPKNVAVMYITRYAWS